MKLELSETACWRCPSNNPDLGEAHEEIDVDYAGEELSSIAFNARYLTGLPLGAMGKPRR